MEKEKKQNIIEREYTIPLRKKVRAVPKYKKTNKAVKTVKEFLVRHMKIYDRDLNKIKINKYLNEYLWFRGIRKPPYKIKVKVIKEGDLVKVELANLPEKLKFKKAREEKREAKAKSTKKIEKQTEKTEKEKSAEEKPVEKEAVSEKQLEEKREEAEDKNKDGVDDKKEEIEKKTAVVEAGQKFEKAEHKKQKHTTKSKPSILAKKEEITTNKTY